MFKIKNKDIYLNRGDAISIILNCTDDNSFSSGDFLKFSIVEKGNYNNVVFQKNFIINEECSSYTIELTSSDTEIGDAIETGSVTYWYEIELNQETTLVGYDEKGAKLFVLYPEAATKEAEEGDSE